MFNEISANLLNAQPIKINEPDIYVESEFAPLRRVVLTESEFTFPAKEMDQSDIEFLAADDQKKFQFQDIQGKDHADAFPERQKRWESERENLKGVLERYGVEVLRPRKLTSSEKAQNKEFGYSNFFVRDPFFTVGNVVIEGSMRFLHRRQEVLPLREIFKQQVMPSECIYVAVPQPEIAEKNDTTLGSGPFLEGGDVLVLGKHVFVGSSGLASNKFGAEWIKKLLSPMGYTVEYVRLKPNILHLDCALGLVREGLMIVCESAFLDGIPEKLKHWDKILVTEKEASLLATNGLPINEKSYVLDPAFSNIGESLDQFGITVETVDFSISRSFGGSFRCSTQPLLRYQ